MDEEAAVVVEETVVAAEEAAVVVEEAVVVVEEAAVVDGEAAVVVFLLPLEEQAVNMMENSMSTARNSVSLRFIRKASVFIY